MSANTAVQKGLETKSQGSVGWWKFRKKVSPAFITAITIILLGIFLMPFLYMIFTSLKSNAQMTQSGSPIWPGRNPTYLYTGENTQSYTLKVNKAGFVVNQAINMGDYAGKKLEIYTVPLEDGTTKDLALVKGFQKGSIFIDPANPAADPIVWAGPDGKGAFFKTLSRPWIFSPTWANYKEMWDAIDYPQVLWNTFKYALVTTIGVLVSCILVAYGFSRFRFPGRDFLFVILISILFLPSVVTVIPTFTFFTKIGWVGTWLPLMVPSFFANPFDTFLLRQYFMTLPRELDEAAMMDGAGPMRILWSVIIPQSYPVIVAVTVFHIVYAWNDYFGPLIYLVTKMDQQPVSVALARFNGIYGTRPELIQAGSLVTLIIPLIIFILAQRFFVQGIVITGVEK
jgi:multiple sugar transport system permease protein